MSEPIKTIITPDQISESFSSWSVSKIKTLQKCPLQFYLKYLLKLKATPLEVTEGDIATMVGKDAHLALELALGGIPLREALAKVKAQSELPENSWSEVENLEYNIQAFVDRINNFKFSHKIKNIYQEKRIAITKDLQPTSFYAKNSWLKGVIDFIIELHNGDVIIIDHKRGGNPEFGLKMHKFQLETYLPLYNYGVASINSGQVGVHFIQAGQLITSDLIPKDETEGRIINDVRFRIDVAVDNVVDSGKFDYERGSHCTYCDYRDLCKGGKRGTANELQQFIEKSKSEVETWSNVRED